MLEQNSEFLSMQEREIFSLHFALMSYNTLFNEL
jgi:hypothetical protein